MVLQRAGDIYNCDDSLRASMKRKTVSNRKVIYNKTISSQTRLCDSLPSTSSFSLTFWVKTSLCALWHICSSGHINELFCEALKHFLTQCFSLKKTIWSYTTCFHIISVTFAIGVLSPSWTIIHLLPLHSSEMLEVNKLTPHNMSHYTAGHGDKSQLMPTGKHPSNTPLYTG